MMFDNVVFTDVFFCMPAGVATLIFLATIGGWGLKKR